jgi:hypothetical protein
MQVRLKCLWKADAMRLWSFHPRYLDTKGLVGVWREALLAQKVLQNQTIGYRNHPQLKRFAAASDPIAAIGAYLYGIYQEAVQRSYRFDRDKIAREEFNDQIACTRGQLMYEWSWLREKLKRRDAQRYKQNENIVEPEPHPLFCIVDGDIEAWEVLNESFGSL